MVKVDPMKKMLDIDEQIKKLKEKQKRLISKAQREAGKFLMEQWNVNDLEQAKELIEHFKEQALQITSTQEKFESNDSQTSSENINHENTPSPGNSRQNENTQEEKVLQGS
ncbi:hypothetical protein [Bacillus cereus]